jgi:hypothetical protein
MSAISVQLSNQTAGGVSMPPRRLLRAYLIEAKYETVRMLRTPAFAIPFLGLPAVLYLLFGVVIFGAAIRNDSNAGLFIYAAFALFGVMGPGNFGFGMVVASEREHGLLTLKRALPMPPPAYLVAKLLMAMLFAAIVMATMFAVTPLGHLHLNLSQFLALAAVGILGGAPVLRHRLVYRRPCHQPQRAGFRKYHLSDDDAPLRPVLSTAEISPRYRPRLADLSSAATFLSCRRRAKPGQRVHAHRCSRWRDFAFHFVCSAPPRPQGLSRKRIRTGRELALLLLCDRPVILQFATVNSIVEEEGIRAPPIGA